MGSARHQIERPDPPASGPRSIPSPPTRLGPYRLIERIGSGGVGVVHKAIHEETGHLAAVKVARHDEPDFRNAIRREIDVLGRCDHPGIVQLLAHSEDSNAPWYAMELLEGASMRVVFEQRRSEASGPRSHPKSGRWSLVARPRALRPECLYDALRVVERLCEPLSYLHEEGFVHADVKPENVFVCEDGRVVLVDLGAARSIDEATVLPSSWDGTTFGTWTYMAPELRIGTRCDGRADAYSIGCILYEVVVGHTPAEHSVFRRGSDPERAPVLDAVPSSLAALIRRLIALEADRRPERISECMTELAAVLRDHAPPTDVASEGRPPAPHLGVPRGAP